MQKKKEKTKIVSTRLPTALVEALEKKRLENYSISLSEFIRGVLMKFLKE
jgi:hypothetical protein